MQIRGVRGSAPPATTKVALTGVGGWENSVLLALTGIDLDAKAALVERSVHRYIDTADGLDAVVIDRVRPGPGRSGQPERSNAAAEDRGPRNERGCRKRLFIVDRRAGPVQLPGMYSLSPPQPGSAFRVYWHALLEQRLLEHMVHHHDGTTESIARIRTR
ncbi:MAG: acyclic terpene utilization AtuA family protein [Mycobacterium sp.]